MNTHGHESKRTLRRRGEEMPVFIRATIPKSFVILRRFLPRKNANGRSSPSAFFVFSCGHNLWLRRQPRWVDSWFHCRFRLEVPAVFLFQTGDGTHRANWRVVVVRTFISVRTNRNCLTMWIIEDTMWALKKVFTILFLLGVIFVSLCVIVPLFLPHRCRYQTQKEVCIANLKQLQGAQATWAMELQKTTNDTPSVRDLVGKDLYIRDEPVCWSGGSYTLARVGEPPRCSVPGHTL